MECLSFHSPDPQVVLTFLNLRAKQIAPLALDACRTTLGKCPHLLNCCHACVAGKRGQKRSVRPPEFQRILWRLASQQSVKEARRKTVAAQNFGR